MKKNFFSMAAVAICLMAQTTIASAQSEGDVNRWRIPVKTLIPNIVGLTGEAFFPVANNRLSIAAGYSHIPFGGSADLPIEEEGDVNRWRIGVKTLIPNIVGLTGEAVLPVANNRLSIAVDYSHIPFGGLAELLLEEEGEVNASINYFSAGVNFYLNKSGRAKGPYLGSSFANLNVRSSAETTGTSTSGKISLNTFNFRFGLTTGGPFLFGFEIGGGLPMGNLKGELISTENGRPSVENYDEPLPIGVLPIFNLKFGVAF
jgi:hypothetical protein